MLPRRVDGYNLSWPAEPTNMDWESALSAIDRPIFLYLHGNAFNRAALHRRELYDLLADMQYHVIAFDYRGYGDSLGWWSNVFITLYLMKVYSVRIGLFRSLVWSPGFIMSENK